MTAPDGADGDNGSSSSSSAGTRQVTSSMATRPKLPERAVTSDTIDDAFSAFVLYCNPGVPVDTDTENLKEAFRTPPKSDGNTFSSFTLLGLIKKLHEKEIKTWSELALKLGVAPPDLEKGQSSQKVQQYAVRLKRWMHSMHIDAFFEYLLGNAHPYWTDVPQASSSIGEEERDGVAIEDDMALRALLPQFRPRRGRRKADDEGPGQHPSQRPKLSPPSVNGDLRRDVNVTEPWTALPDGRAAFVFPSAEQARSTIIKDPDSRSWNANTAPTPASLYPQSAITPASRTGFWADEPQSAVTPSRNKIGMRRHGSKVVSSAWRGGGAMATGARPRGRPPASRTSEALLQMYQEDVEEAETTKTAADATSIRTQPEVVAMPDSEPLPEVLEAERASSSLPTLGRQSRPGRLSLQVPQRPGGPVRLATPPLLQLPQEEPVATPTVMLNGANFATGAAAMEDRASETRGADDGAALSNSSVFLATKLNSSDETSILDNDADQTSRSKLESFVASEFMSASWLDSSGNPIPTCQIEEAVGLANAVFQKVEVQSRSVHDFLLNLCSLAGFRMLRCINRKTKVTKSTREGSGEVMYLCEWPLQFSSLTGSFSMTVTVSRAKWNQDAKVRESVDYWKQKYRHLLGFMGDGYGGT